MEKDNSKAEKDFSEKLRRIYKLLQILLDVKKPDIILENIIRESADILKADAGTIVLWESNLGFFNSLYNIPSDIPLKGMILIPEQGGLDGRIFREKSNQPVALSNYSKNMDAYPQLKKANFEYAIGIPLNYHNSEIIGTLCFYFKTREKKISSNEKILVEEIGKQTSIAILNAKLNQQYEASKKVENEARNFLDLLLNSSLDIIINTDLTGKIKFWNKAAEKCTNFTASMMMNKKIPLVSGENEEKFYNLFGDARKGKTILNQKFELIHQNSQSESSEKTRLINLSLVPVRNQKESLDSILITGQDISEKHNLLKKVDEYNVALNQKELALVQKDRILHQTQEELIIAEKLATIGVISDKLNHQINNPLMSMISALSIHMDDIEDLKQELKKNKNKNKDNIEERLKSNISEIIHEGNRIKVVLKELRNFSEIAKEKHFRENTDLVEVVNQSIVKFKNDTEFSKIKIKVNNKVSEAKIFGNFNQLQYIIFEILKNSLKAIEIRKIYSPESGNIDISLDNFNLNQKKYIRMIISDDGIGLDKNQIEKLFEPFYTDWFLHDGNDSDSQTKHIGLSLATTYIILQNHHAIINIQSNKNAKGKSEKSNERLGTHIYIDFPLL